MPFIDDAISEEDHAKAERMANYLQGSRPAQLAALFEGRGAGAQEAVEVIKNGRHFGMILNACLRWNNNIYQHMMLDLILVRHPGLAMIRRGEVVAALCGLMPDERLRVFTVKMSPLLPIDEQLPYLIQNGQDWTHIMGLLKPPEIVALFWTMRHEALLKQMITDPEGFLVTSTCRCVKNALAQPERRFLDEFSAFIPCRPSVVPRLLRQPAMAHRAGLVLMGVGGANGRFDQSTVAAVDPGSPEFPGR
jgi:hypothetical protein